MDRRTFLSSVAGAAFLPLLPASASPEQKLTTEEIAAWKAALFDRGEPLTYRALTQPQAAFPTGGIGCGNLYIGAGGHLRDWLIFNNVKPQQVPNSFFAVRAAVGGAAPIARILQTEMMGLHVIGPFGGTYRSGMKAVPAPGPCVQDVELQGEYPSATLRYLDPALPVEVRLEAFTPWVPLDADASAIPGTVFLFHVRNPQTKEAKVSLLTALHNAAGFGNPGANFNQAWHKRGVSGVRMGILAGRVPRLDHETELIAAVEAFRLPEVERPEGLTVHVIRPASPTAAELRREARGRKVLWLEDPDTLEPDAAKALRKEVEDGATLLVSGTGSGVLAKWAGALRQPADPRPNVLFDDFESGTYEKWTVEGEAFGKEPPTGALAGQQTVSGFHGKRLVNSFLGGDPPKGRLTSAPFTIERRFIRFLIGGGARAGTTCMNLLVDGKAVRTATGHEAERLESHAWDVAQLEGRTARLEIVDQESGGWGHVNVDDIVFSDRPGEELPPASVQELAALLPVSYDGASYAEGSTLVTLPAREPARQNEEPLLIGLAGRLKIEGPHLLPGAETMAGAGGEPVLWRRKVGHGRVLLLGGPLFPAEERRNQSTRDQALTFLAYAAGLKYEPGSGIHPHDAAFGELALATAAGHPSGLLTWDEPAELWSAFSEGRLAKLPGRGKSHPTPPGLSTNTAISVEVTLPPGAEAGIPFFLTWHFPNYYFQDKRVLNRYAARWKGARDSAAALASDWKRRREKTERYRRTAYESTLPYYLVDCLTSQSSTIRSEVCIWLDDGAFAGYEGADGCCPMNCSHVWGYEQSLARLFPGLEKAMRDTDYKHQQRKDGGINNRVALPLQPEPTGEHPFADGHASEILKAYREHLNSPTPDWLRDYWPRIKKAVDYLLELDGAPPDGVIEGEQWNTYDCAVYGPNTFIGSYYLAALRAGEEMAKLMGEPETARKWRGVFTSGRQRLIDLCWNGEYFVQNYPDYEKRATQWGPGCLADQVIGQWWAHQMRLGCVLPQEKVRSALRAVFQHNWRWDFSDFKHKQRVYADRHDKGLLNCTWPRGGRPANPILYCDEVWTGVEYQVAGHMIYEGMLEEAFTIVRGARERYDGRRRSPWNEMECGGHYARAMASWGMLLALSGFHHDGPAGLLAFDPVYKPESFRSLFTASEGWGSFSQERQAGRQHTELRLDHGRLRLSELRLGVTAPPKSIAVRCGSRAINATPRVTGNTLRLTMPRGFVLSEGEALTVELS